jgi:hypothetical protein
MPCLLKMFNLFMFILECFAVSTWCQLSFSFLFFCIINMIVNLSFPFSSVENNWRARFFSTLSYFPIKGIKASGLLSFLGRNKRISMNCSLVITACFVFLCSFFFPFPLPGHHHHSFVLYVLFPFFVLFCFFFNFILNMNVLFLS